MLLFSTFFGMKFWCLLLNSNLCKKNESFMLLISKLSGMKFRSLLLNNLCKRNVLSFPWIIFSMFHSLLLVKNNMTSCWSTNYILMNLIDMYVPARTFQNIPRIFSNTCCILLWLKWTNMFFLHNPVCETIHVIKISLLH